MAEIQEIIDHILEKYKNEASSIISDAEKAYEAKMADYGKIADNEYNSYMDLARQDSEKTVDMALLGAKQQIARAVLELKNKAISDIMKKAKEKILLYSEIEYDEFLTALLNKNHQGGDGELIMCENDKSKALKKFKSALKALGLTLSGDTVRAEAGFILKFGKCEQNCTLEAVLKDKSETLCDYINENLFK